MDSREYPNRTAQTSGIRKIVLPALLGVMTVVCKAALAPIPNTEPVTLLLMVFSSVLGWEALAVAFVYASLECLLWGAGLWNICSFYTWPILVALSVWMKRANHPIAWAALAGGFGLVYGGLCSFLSLLISGWQEAAAWWISGLVFDLIHGTTNFLTALILFLPCRQRFRKLAARYGISEIIG